MGRFHQVEELGREGCVISGLPRLLDISCWMFSQPLVTGYWLLASTHKLPVTGVHCRHCTLYTLYIVQCVHCTLYSIHCVYCTLYNIQSVRILYIVHCIVYSLYTVHCTVYSVLYFTVYSL